MNGRWFYVLALGVVLLAAGLRLPNLATRSLWFDEAVAANNSGGSLAETIRDTRAENSCPILYPLILFGVQKADRSAATVRAPSYLSSILLIGLVLAAGRALVGSWAALLAALWLAIAPSQIHFAQELREYAFSSLAAALMTFAFLDFLDRPGERGPKWRFCAMLAVAPLVQYGLVLYALAILSAAAWTALANRTVAWRDIVLAASCSGAAGLFSLLFTLRYQWGQDTWYLSESLFVPGKTNPLRFLSHNTQSFLTFVAPGSLAVGIVALGLALVLLLVPSDRSRAIRRLLVCALGIAVLAAVCHAYPFGGVRQCLYLSPLIAIAASVGLATMTSQLGSAQNLRCLAAIAGIFLASGVTAIRSESFNKEFEDSRTVLNRLAALATPSDDVYIYYGARPAAQFYASSGREPGFISNELARDNSDLSPGAVSSGSPDANFHWRFFVKEGNGKRVIWGGIYRANPEKYTRELLSALRPGTRRIWLVFSHIAFEEDARITADLQRAGWTVTERVRPTGAALYEATLPAGGAAAGKAAVLVNGNPVRDADTNHAAPATVGASDSVACNLLITAEDNEHNPAELCH